MSTVPIAQGLVECRVMQHTPGKSEQRAEARQAALEKDAQRYRKLRNVSMDERNRLEHYAGPALDEALDALPAVRAA